MRPDPELNIEMSAVPCQHFTEQHGAAIEADSSLELRPATVAMGSAPGGMRLPANTSTASVVASRLSMPSWRGVRSTRMR